MDQKYPPTHPSQCPHSISNITFVKDYIQCAECQGQWHQTQGQIQVIGFGVQQELANLRDAITELHERVDALENITSILYVLTRRSRQLEDATIRDDILQLIEFTDDDIKTGMLTPETAQPIIDRVTKWLQHDLP